MGVGVAFLAEMLRVSIFSLSVAREELLKTRKKTARNTNDVDLTQLEGFVSRRIFSQSKNKSDETARKAMFYRQ